jgi:hypothetical protein
MAGLELKSGDVRRQRKRNAKKDGVAQVTAAALSTKNPKSKSTSLSKKQETQKAKEQDKGSKCVDEDRRTDSGSNTRSLRSERDPPEEDTERNFGVRLVDPNCWALIEDPNTGEIECVRANCWALIEDPNTGEIECVRADA